MIGGVIVMKFGGGALGDARGCERAAAVVRAALPRRPLVVVSAFAGVTDALLELARAPSAEGAAGVAALHRQALAALRLDAGLLEPLLRELDELVRGVRMVGGATDRIADQMASFGERLSARVLAAVLSRQGVPATAVDAWDLGLRTDSAFGRAQPLADDGRIAAALPRLAGVPVVTGYIGKDTAGNVTTLGRNGSDFSAAWIGAAAAADEIQVWKDVAGVHTADPKVVPQSRPIRTLGYDEACELSWFGSKVLHPATMLPAIERGIPLTVRSLAEPDAPGTAIVAAGGHSGPQAVVHDARSAVHRVERREGTQAAFLGAVCTVLARHAADLRPPILGDGAVTLMLSAADRALLADLAQTGTVRAVKDAVLVGLVGRNVGSSPECGRDFLTALGAAGSAPLWFETGARPASVAALVPEAHWREAVQALHARFFG
jgi:aspartate kinase